MMKIVFASGNPGKVREAAEILGKGFQLITSASVGITEDIPETGLSIRANSLQKARYIYEKTGMDCFADDTGLEVDLLGGAPGVETARYAGPGRDPSANIDKLLAEMDRRTAEASMARSLGVSIPPRGRTARFRTAVTLILGGEVYTFDGIMEGSIARVRHGAGGFGYDPVFIPAGYNCTAAELSEDEKNAISHRGQALRAMADFLKTKKQ
jgi:XTP/dITP diphosphohydrolase